MSIWSPEADQTPQRSIRCPITPQIAERARPCGAATAWVVSELSRLGRSLGQICDMVHAPGERSRGLVILALDQRWHLC